MFRCRWRWVVKLYRCYQLLEGVKSRSKDTEGKRDDCWWRKLRKSEEWVKWMNQSYSQWLWSRYSLLREESVKKERVRVSLVRGLDRPDVALSSTFRKSFPLLFSSNVTLLFLLHFLLLPPPPQPPFSRIPLCKFLMWAKVPFFLPCLMDDMHLATWHFSYPYSPFLLLTYLSLVSIYNIRSDSISSPFQNSFNDSLTTSH